MGIRLDIRNARALAAALAVAACPAAPAFTGPLVTATCEAPKGSTQEFGVSLKERVLSHVKSLPQPPPTYKGPFPDGFTSKPTFIVDTGKLNLTLLWAESAADLAMREDAKKYGFPKEPPPPAEQVAIVAYSPTAIIAISSSPGHAAAYSLYPKLGVLFMTTHSIDGSGQNAAAMTVFAKCTFSWN